MKDAAGTAIRFLARRDPFADPRLERAALHLAHRAIDRLGPRLFPPLHKVPMTHTTTKERPILFSGPMILALLDGRKTQTRRLLKPQPVIYHPVMHRGELWDETHMIQTCPYGHPGERLWVRETFNLYTEQGDPYPTGHGLPKSLPEGYHIVYLADAIHGGAGDISGIFPFRPSIHMPRWASRITLEITEVRVERINDISAADKLAEGATADQPFGTIWSKLHTTHGTRLRDNPWVWVVTFRQL